MLCRQICNPFWCGWTFRSRYMKCRALVSQVLPPLLPHKSFHPPAPMPLPSVASSPNGFLLPAGLSKWPRIVRYFVVASMPSCKRTHKCTTYSRKPEDVHTVHTKVLKVVGLTEHTIHEEVHTVHTVHKTLAPQPRCCFEYVGLRTQARSAKAVGRDP